MTLDPKSFLVGEDVTEQFAPAPKAPGMVISVRLGKEDAERLLALAAESHRTVSQVARDALHQYLFLKELTGTTAWGAATFYSNLPTTVYGFMPSAKTFGAMQFLSGLPSESPQSSTL